MTVSLGLASPALAQHHRGGGDGGHGSNRGSENHATAAPRATPPPAAAPAPRSDNGPRRDNGARAERTPGYNNNRNDNWRGSGQRDQHYAAPRSYSNGGGVYRNDGYRNYSYRGSYDRHGYYNHVAPTRFYRPYYSFRPRFSLGFGLWVGYPVPYAYSYYDPFYDSAPYGYPYPSTPYPSTPYPSYPPPSSGYPQYPPSTYPQSAPDPNSIGVQPGQANTGGLSFDITPSDAQVLVDGNFAGTVDQFTANSQPLGLPAGRHQIRIEAPGFQAISFDVNIVAGQVIPYQGSMERR